MAASKLPTTLGALRDAGHSSQTVREELRKNTAKRIESGEPLFPGIVGYEETVLPELENALLAGQDIIILGERGQAKSRIIRSLPLLLDDAIPVVRGCAIHDDPFNPICRECRDRVAADGDRLEVEWLPRDARYGEKLATPDVTMADLIGDVDPIKVAEGRYLSDELTIHYGIIPRTNRGVFCINELPDLSERIQVGLFNLMEERDVQIKGYNVRLPLDVFIVATANPEDYTNRGRIITPLKDRYGAQVRTHYPKTIGDELAIVGQERAHGGPFEARVSMPDYMSEIVAQITNFARSSPEVNQRSGVSVRLSIANFETLRATALRRALRDREQCGAPRITDLPALVSSMRGKIELETIEENQETRLIEQLTKRAVATVFNDRLGAQSFSDTLEYFAQGGSVQASPMIPSGDYRKLTDAIPGMKRAVSQLVDSGTDAETASAVEFVLEGLYLDRKLNRDRLGDRFQYAQPKESFLGREPDFERRRRRRRSNEE